MVVERMVIAPQRPPIRQAVQPTQAQPDRKAVRQAERGNQASWDDLVQSPPQPLEFRHVIVACRLGRLRSPPISDNLVFIGQWDRIEISHEHLTLRARAVIRPCFTRIIPDWCANLILNGVSSGDRCGPQDSNLQPRDSSALAFPRGLDYLILLEGISFSHGEPKLPKG